MNIVTVIPSATHDMYKWLCDIPNYESWNIVPWYESKDTKGHVILFLNAEDAIMFKLRFSA